MRQSAALALALVLCVVQWSTALAGFFVCPSQCQAKLLPRDMESLEDCLCQGDVSALLDNNNANPGTAFRCPDGSSAKRLHPMSFADCACLSGYTRDDMRKACTSDQFKCRGRYRPKEGVSTPESIADCDCQHPYKKDEAAGQCVLRKCPRAGNYIKKSGVGRVASLADCSCIDPYLKNEQSGECMVDTVFQCPTFSQPLPGRRIVSFADCECDWGFVRSPKNTCEREAAPYACPKHSIKRANLGIGERARSFADCECEGSTEFRRNEKLHKCERINEDVDGDGVDELDPDEGFVCPPMSKALAPFPHSIEQCECLPGFGWKTPEMTCVRLSGYTCPPHSYKADDAKHIEERFTDCECARGYYRDDSAGACLEWFLANDNGCPEFAFLRHWPLQSKANCQCVYGLSVPSPEPTMDQDQDGDDEEETESPQQRQRKQLRQQKRAHQKKPAAQCNRPPVEFISTSFSECPSNSVAISWPLASSDDCLCKEGFGIAPLGEDGLQRGDGASFVCVDPTESITEDDEDKQLVTVSCQPPMVKNPFTSDCRLPVEQVRPRNSKRKSKDALPTRGEVLFKGIEYDYVLTEDNVMVIQGDVAIGELVTWSPPIGEDGSPVATDRPMPPPTPVLHGYYNSERDHRWEDATMCFEVDPSAKAFESVVDEAMDHITAVTNFKFRQCRGNDCHTDVNCAHDFVSVKKTSSSCYSYVGRIGGKQLLGVSAECGLGNIIHVLLHAVGLHHTIDRADRDDHVRIAWECVPENQRANFVVEDLNVTSSATDTPYDFFSIMHHPADAFVRIKGVRSAIPQWCQSIFPIIAMPEERVAVMARMGQRQLLAVTDIHAVWKLYPTLQSQDKPPTYESVVANGDSDKAMVHESRLHTQDDVVRVDGKSAFAKKNGKSSWAKKISSFFGAMVTLVGFGLFVSFAVVEFRRRALIHSSGGYYSESLLADKAMYD